MAATTTDFSQSVAYNSYIGSVLSLISKSEIRYQGVLSHVDTLQSSIGLQNVRSFGTEGRRKDGPQILPSDKIYDYIYFRGTDVKDLQVLSSPPLQSAPAMPDDPAIISTNYIPTAPSSASLPPAGSEPATNFSSNIQLGLSNSTFQSMGPWFPSLPPSSNDNGRATPLYWRGFNGPSAVQPTSGFVGAPSQQIPYSATNACMPSGSSSFFQFPTSVLPSFSTDKTTIVFPPNSSSLNLSVGGSTLLTPIGVRNHLENIQPTFIPSAKLGTPLVPSSTSFLLDTNPAVRPTAYNPNSVFASGSPSQGIFTSMPSVDGASVTNPASASNHFKAPMPPLGKAEYILQSMPSSFSSPHILQTDQKDIEVDQASASESLSIDAKERDQALFSVPAAEKLSGASVHPHDKMHQGGRQQQQKQGERERKQQQERGVAGGGKKGFHGADSHANQGIKTWHANKDKFPGADSRPNQGIRTWLGSRDKLIGASAHYHHSNRAHGQERGKEFHGGAELSLLSYYSHVKVSGSSRPPYHGNKSHERQNWVSGPSSSPNLASKGHARGKQYWISHPVMKFTEDFDFEAMNEKINKDEVWGQLGKSYKTESKEKEDAIGSKGDGLCQVDDNALPKIETNIYIKDDFFDSLFHGDTLNRELKDGGRIKLSDRKKLDKETFGDVQLNRGAYSGMRRGRGGQSGGHGHTMIEKFDDPQSNRGARGGRGWGGHGRTGMVEERAVWCRVT